MAKKKKPAELVNENSRYLFDQSEALANFAQNTLQTLSAKLTADIVSVSGTALETAVTTQAMQSLLRGLGEHLAAATASVEQHAADIFERGYQQQFTSVLRQVNAFESVAPSGFTASELTQLGSLQPKITGNLIKATFEGSLDQLSLGMQPLKAELQQKISLNVLTGGSYSDLIKDIKGSGIITGPLQQAEMRARRIAITETTNVFNYARVDSIQQANAGISEEKQIQKQWHSILDGATSRRCKSLNGQIRKSGEPFKAADGWTGEKPAAHPHCRSEVIPYRKEWQPILDQLIADLTAQ